MSRTNPADYWWKRGHVYNFTWTEEYDWLLSKLLYCD